MNKIIQFLRLAMLLLPVAMFSAHGGDLTPLALVTVTVDEVIADMNSHEERYAEDSTALEAMVHERVEPHFNVPRMVQLAMAKNWATAAPEQRRAVITEFRQMLIRSYMNAMFNYRKEKISLNGEEQIKGRNAMVRLRVARDSGDDVDLVLRMYQTNGHWQVIDVVVGGVSMLITFRSQFQDQITKNGIDGLIDSLRSGNLGESGNADA
jgi:phospholipid transport system substrate-binding protein